MKGNLKHIYKAGYGVYLVFFVLAIVFFKERTIFVDISFHLFEIIRTEDIAIQNFRFVSAFTQVFPLLARKINLSLQAIMVIYSCCFVFYYFLCYWLTGHVLKQYKLALVLLLSQVLFVTHTFYWIQSELPQGLAFMIVVIALMNTIRADSVQPLKLALLFAGILTVVFAHPLILFPFGFIVAYQMFNGKVIANNKILISAAVFFVLIFIIKKIGFSTQYDSGALGAGAKNFMNLFPNYFTIPSNKTFLLNCITKYYWIPVIGILSSIIYILQKKWLKLVLFISAVVGFLLLVNVSYAFAGAEDFYIENLYLPVAIMLAIPIVYDIYPHLQENFPKMASTFILLIIITGVVRIYLNHDTYTNRLAWERNFLDKHADEKLLLAKINDPANPLLMTWGTPYEFWLLSTIERNETASICIHENIEGFSWVVNEQVKNAFVTQWGVFYYHDLPQKYFKFTDSTGSYKIIE